MKAPNKIVELGSVAEIVMGLSPPGSTYNRAGIGSPLLNGPTEFGTASPEPDVFTTDPKRTAQSGDILFCVRGSTTGRMNWADQEYAIGRGIAAIRARDCSDTHYLRGCIENHLPGLLQKAGGSTFPNLSFRDLATLEIPFPPLPVQRKISALLSAYDDLIENNNRRIKLLEEMAQRIYKEWFVDFRYPGHEDVPLVESELGLIPEGWKVHRLGDDVELVYGKALKADARQAGEVVVFGSGGAIGRHNEALDLGPGIIVGRKGNVGAVYWSDGPFFAIDTTYWVRSWLPLTYCYFALRDMEFIDSHAAVPGLSREQAYALPLLMPDSDVSKRFEVLVTEVFAFHRAIEDANATLHATRDLLLPRLISGEVDVSDLDIALPEAAA